MSAGNLRLVKVGGIEWAVDQVAGRVWRAARLYTAWLSPEELTAGLQYLLWAPDEERLQELLEKQAEIAERFPRP